MADADDVRRIALALPAVEEIPSDGFDFRVGNKGFVWSYPERIPGRQRQIRVDIAVLYVGDVSERQALLLGEPDLFSTARGYEEWPLVLLRLDAVDVERLEELITDAWHMRAPDDIRAQLFRPGHDSVRSVLRIDHIIFAAPVLEDGVRELETRFGIGAGAGGQHLGQGTHNALLALGPRTYLEVVAPDPAQPDPGGPRPYGVDGVERAGLVGWALACDDIDAAVRDARAAGFDPGDVIEGHRLTSAGAMLRWRVTSNARTAGVTPFLISWGDTPHPATSAPSGLQLDSIRLEHPDPVLINHRMRTLGLRVEVAQAEHPALAATISGPTGAGELR